MPGAFVLGCAGPVLTDAERRFFADVDPLGFILFKRNCETPAQVRALVAALRASVGRSDAPVLIDQEGGRVQRLGPPHWPARPPAVRLATLYQRDRTQGLAAARLLGRVLADDLAAVGITVDCAPVLDLPVPGSHDIIGDRALGTGPEQVAELGRAVCEGLLAGGVLPVVKHIPGHGRARVDSHLALPVVDEPAEVLAASDFAPFAALSDMPLAMTAHILYTALDAARPATLSPTVIDRIRHDIGFAGLLLSDDLSMAALPGTLAERARGAIAAGCDVALHCNGRLDEMAEVAAEAGVLATAGAERWRRAEALRTGAVVEPAANAERVLADMLG